MTRRDLERALDGLAFVLEGLDALDQAEAGALLELPAVEDLERLEGDLALAA